MELNENHLSLSWEVTSTVLQAQSRGGKEMSRLRDVLTSHTLTSYGTLQHLPPAFLLSITPWKLILHIFCPL